MARFRLDDRGILTIIDDQDGILSPIARFARGAAILLFCLAVVSSVALYCTFYLPEEDSFAALSYCAERIAGGAPPEIPEKPLESFPFFEEAGGVADTVGAMLGSVMKFLWDGMARCVEAVTDWLETW